MAMEIVDDLGNDADAEDEGFEEEEEENGDAARAAAAASSMPGTPDHAAAAAAASGKEYASESEAAWIVGGRRRANHHRQQQRQRRRTTSAQRRRENWVERAWDMRRSMMTDQNQNQNQNRNGNRRVPAPEREEEVGGRRRRSWMRMDLEEVQACRDLGLGLPPAWTVELPYGLSGGETTSSGGNSPSGGSWRISSPGDDPREVKARLKAWAQAVVLASASHLQD